MQIHILNQSLKTGYISFMARFGIENKLFRCDRTDACYELTLYFTCNHEDDKQYLDFNCANKFNCGIYGKTEDAFGEFEWGVCPAYKMFKPDH